MGVLEVYNEEDYGEVMLVGSIDSLENLPKNYENYLKNKIAYHQPDVSKSSCAIHAGLTIISNQINIKFPTEQIMQLWELAIRDYGAVEGKGMMIYKAVDLLRIWINSIMDEKFKTFSIKTDSYIFRELLKKGYMAQGGYYGDSAYTRDKNDDGVINTIHNTKRTYGHSICWYDPKKDKVIIGGIDNYTKTSPFNEYEITNFKELVENGVVFKHSYFYIPEKYLKMGEIQIPDHIPVDEFAKDEQGIVRTWEKTMRIGKKLGYTDEYHNYTDGSKRIILMKMLIDIKDIRKLAKKQ